MAAPGQTCRTWRTSSETSATRRRRRGQRSLLTVLTAGLKIVHRLTPLFFQLQQSARRLPDDDSGLSACPPPLHGFLSHKAASLHSDDSVVVVLQG